MGHDVPDVDRLELAARSAYETGDLDGAVDAWERLHGVLLSQGETSRAARAAAMVALHLLVDSGLMAPVRGWIGRAERLVASSPEDPAHALVAMVRTYERFLSGDAVAARVQADRAIELGTRLDVPPAVVVGRTALARLLVSQGRVAEGLALLDELAVDLVSPGIDPLSAGMMLCELVCCAQSLGRPDLAREWTEVFDRWRVDRAVGGLHGRCRVHRAELLRFSGPAADAEAEALAASQELRPWLRREMGWPLVELGTIRLQRGDLAGAEAALLAAHGHAWCPQPSLARVRLAQGRTQEALDMIRDAVAHPLPIPSKERPPFDDLRSAPLLDGLAEIGAAAGRADLADQAATALAGVAAKYGGPVLHAWAAVARARAVLAGGVGGSEAVTACTEAVACCAEAGGPYETARARLLLAQALDGAGLAAAAALERTAAREALRDFGAVAPPDRPPAGDPPVVAGTAEPVPAATGVFTAVGGVRTVALGGERGSVPDLKGLRYVAILLSRPGEEVHVLDLVAAESGGPRIDQPGLPALDETARASYRRRLLEVEADLEEARRDHDLAREELAERDRDYLLAELSAALSLGGRTRTRGGSAERARSAVTRSIRYALGRLAETQPVVAAHLEASVLTGTACRYRPDPLAPVTWTV